MKVLYEDQDVLVVYKEAGLPVQAGSASRKDLISELKNYLRTERESATASVDFRQTTGGRSKIEGKNSQIIEEKVRPAVGVSAGKLSSAEKKALKTGEPYLGIIHRLDQPVEGILVFAKNNKAAGELSRQVQAKADGRSDMRKVYQAMVLLPDKAAYEKAVKAQHSVVLLQDYLRRNFQKNTTEIVPEGTKDARWAELTFRTLRVWKEAEYEKTAGKDTACQEGQSAEAASKISGAGNCQVYGRALLEIHLHTGRHHQIRVQMAGAGMPLDGDRKYGPAGVTYDYNLRLCASFLQFRHPASGKKMQFSVEPSFLP